VHLKFLTASYVRCAENYRPKARSKLS